MSARLPYPDTDTRNIPLALIDHDQFVAWRWEWRDGKDGRAGTWTKILVNPRTGRNARSNDPSTWGTFNEAVDHAIRHNLGIGYVFHESDPFTGIDFDDCLDPDTGEVDPVALERIRALDSYTEISPSGRGVKVIVRATLPPGRRRIGKTELYDDRRFFTLTGRCFPSSPATIEDRQEQVEQLHHDLFGHLVVTPAAHPAPASSLNLSDHDVIERARQSKQGAKFEQLMAGQWKGWFDSQSEADLSLANMLRFWTGGDRAQVDRIFRTSGLYREKWEREDYRELRVLDPAFAGGEVYRPAPVPHSTPSALQTAAGAPAPAEMSADPCAARVAALALQITAMQAHIDQLEAKNQQLQSHLTQTAGVLQNPHLTAGEKLTLIAVTFRVGQKAQAQANNDPEHDGWVPVALADVAKQATCSPATVSRHIEKARDWGLIDKAVTSEWKPERVTPDGEILPAGYVSELRVRLTKAPEDVLRDMAIIAPERPQTWGGKRDKRPLTCPEHPDAAVRVKRHAFCAECDTPLGELADVLIFRNGDAEVSDQENPIQTGNCILQSARDDVPGEAPDAPVSSQPQCGSSTKDEHLAIPYAQAKNDDALACRICGAALYAPESIARGTCTRHATAPPATIHPLPMVAGGAD